MSGVASVQACWAAVAAAFACVQVPRASSDGGRSMPPIQLWTADSMADPLTAIPAMQAPTPSPNSVPPMMMLRESTVNWLPEPTLVFISPPPDGWDHPDRRPAVPASSAPGEANGAVSPAYTVIWLPRQAIVTERVTWLAMMGSDKTD